MVLRQIVKVVLGMPKLKTLHLRDNKIKEIKEPLP